ncbi:MAG: hypothetical protein AAB578_07165 [Elusimicrobiota bacterium]
MHKEHEDLCVLYHSGELPPAEAARFKETAGNCPECRDLLEALDAGGRLARLDAFPPPRRLDERVSASARESRRGSLFSPRPARLAFAFAAAALLLWSPWKPREALQWADGFDEDVEAVSEDIAAVAESLAYLGDAEFDSELRGLERGASSLEREMGS